MTIKSPKVNAQKLRAAIRYIHTRDRKRAGKLDGKWFYIKPSYIPWAKEVWIGKGDVFLPSNFNDKQTKHQIQDMHRAISMFEEHDMFKEKHPNGWFITWMTSRKIGYVKRALNLRIRRLWKAFLALHPFR